MSSTAQTQTSQSAQTNPYAPSIPLLANDASTTAGISTAVTPEQQAALSALQGESSSIPNLGSQYTGAVTNNLNANTSPQQGMLMGSINNYMNNTNGIASNTDLNPWDTPGFSNAMGTMATDITNNDKSMFAGSGRDPTGNAAAPEAIARGISQGEAPAIAAQYNSNVGNLENANAGQANVANTGANSLTSEQMSALQAQLSGLAGGASLPGLLTQPGQTMLNTANTAYNTPWSNLAPSEASATSIGGMGGTSSGSGTTSQTSPALTNIIGLLTGGAGLAGALAKSDKRLKENIRPVGKVGPHTIYDFNMKSDPKNTPIRGVLAQEVEKVRPDAVMDHDGTKFVDYHKLGLGMLSGARAA